MPKDFTNNILLIVIFSDYIELRTFIFTSTCVLQLRWPKSSCCSQSKAKITRYGLAYFPALSISQRIWLGNSSLRGMVLGLSTLGTIFSGFTILIQVKNISKQQCFLVSTPSENIFRKRLPTFRKQFFPVGSPTENMGFSKSKYNVPVFLFFSVSVSQYRYACIIFVCLCFHGCWLKVYKSTRKSYLSFHRP